MTYIELLQALEQRLGYQHLPLNARASNMKNLFDSTPVHHELMQRLVQGLYRNNACRVLTDTVKRDACFDAVITVRQETLKNGTTDVDAYRLLDDLFQVLGELFPVLPEPTEAEAKRTADVLPFPRRNSR